MPSQRRTSFSKELPAIIAGLTIILGTLAVSRVLAYEYINTKLFIIEIGFALVIGSILLAYSWNFLKKALKQPIVWGMGIFILTLLLSAFRSIDPTTSWFGNVDRGTGVFFLLILSFVAFFLGSILTKEKAKKYILIPISISGIGVILSLYLEKLGWQSLGTAANGGVLGNTSMVGTYLFMSFFITAYLFLSAQTKVGKWIYGIFSLILVCNQILIHFNIHGGIHTVIGIAKGATISVMFGIAIAISIWLFTSRLKIRKTLGIIFFILLLLCATGGITELVRPSSTVHTWFIAQETDARFIYWNIALKGFYAHPVLGTGPETYTYTYQTYFNPSIMLKKNSGEIWSNKVHNMYLQSLSETGLVGLLGYIALFTGLISSFISLYKSDGDRNFIACFGGLLAAYLLNNLIFFDTVTSYLLFFMIVTYCIAASPFEYTKVRERALYKVLRYVIGVGVIVGVSVIVIPQVIKIHRAYEAFIIPLNQRTTWYQKIENTASYGSALFLGQYADTAYQSVYVANFNEIIQQNQANKTIVAESIQGLIDTLKQSFMRYPVNEQGELSMGRLANLKMIIENSDDPDSLTTMKAAAQEAIAISPTNPQGYLLLGQEYSYEQKYDAAYTIFEQAIALEPAVPEGYVSIIRLATLLGDTQKVAYYTALGKSQSDEFAALNQ